eukprot:TRINITY_DN21661_c0_g3_i1.p1 TRINITY_DN21661_c0_g3~~TRINITY_DN21661_c0_g3_i1.p1  ORF type:complete len:205 (-),score=50.80 TRINITY_DN21661_c0_g3_i1:58-672(-)
MGVQIKDLRSAIVREAAMAIGAIAEGLGTDFLAGANFLVPRLVELVGCGNKVIAEQVHGAVLTVLSALAVPDAVCPILSLLLDSKSSQTRAYCATYTTLMIQEWPGRVLTKHIERYTEAVEAAVSDASEMVRQQGRVMYAAFHKQFGATRAASTLSKCDARARRSIEATTVADQDNTEPADQNREMSTDTLPCLLYTSPSPRDS